MSMMTLRELRAHQRGQVREYIGRVLRATGGRRAQAARLAGCNRTHWLKLMRLHDVHEPQSPQNTHKGRNKGRKWS